MRYFGKHIWRTLRASPALPLLILCTVILSVAVAISAVCMEGMFRSHARDREALETAAGDILITLRGDSEMRMLFCEDAEAVAGARAEVMGEYALTAYLKDASGGHLLSAAAVDLERADAFYRFSFTEYGRFTTENIDRSVVLSSTAAQAYGLHVGDEFSLRVLNMEQTYTVQAVAKPTGLLAERELLLSDTGVRRLLAALAPEIAALDEDFFPCSRLMLRADPAERDALFEALCASPAFFEQVVEQTANRTQTDYVLFWQMNIVRLLALLVLVLCGILIGTVLKQLRVRRACEIALFCSVGASRKHLWGLQLTENAVYGALGSLGGILLSHPMARALGSLFTWQREVLRPNAGMLLFGIGFASLFMLGFSLPPLFVKQTELHIGEENEPEPIQEKTGTRGILITLALLVLATALCFFLPPDYGFFSGAAALLSAIRAVYLTAPCVLRALLRLSEHLPEKRSHPVVFLTRRRLKHHPALAQSTRLFSVLLLLLFTLGVCRGVLAEQIGVIQGAVQGELIAVNLPREKEAELRAHPDVAGVMRFEWMLDAVLEDSYSVIAIAADGDVDACVHPALLPKQVPAEGSAAVSVGIAELCRVQTGDALSLTLRGVEHRLQVAEVQAVQSPIIFLPPALADAADPVCIKLADPDDRDAQLALIAALEAEGVMLTDTDEMLDSFMSTMSGFLALLNRIMPVATLISVSGIVNLLAGRYRAEQRERMLLCQCGATRRQLACVYAAELAVLILFAALFAMAGTAFACLILDRVLTAAGMTLFV